MPTAIRSPISNERRWRLTRIGRDACWTLVGPGTGAGGARARYRGSAARGSCHNRRGRPTPTLIGGGGISADTGLGFNRLVLLEGGTRAGRPVRGFAFPRACLSPDAAAGEARDPADQAPCHP